MDPKTSGMKDDKRNLQGEGNYDATRHYNAKHGLSDTDAKK
jgi:hypothetical protein